jgi:hypothetical protein
MTYAIRINQLLLFVLIIHQQVILKTLARTQWVEFGEMIDGAINQSSQLEVFKYRVQLVCCFIANNNALLHISRRLFEFNWVASTRLKPSHCWRYFAKIEPLSVVNCRLYSINTTSTRALHEHYVRLHMQQHYCHHHQCWVWNWAVSATSPTHWMHRSSTINSILSMCGAIRINK